MLFRERLDACDRRFLLWSLAWLFVDSVNAKAVVGLLAKRMLSGPQSSSSEPSVCRFVYKSSKIKSNSTAAIRASRVGLFALGQLTGLSVGGRIRDVFPRRQGQFLKHFDCIAATLAQLTSHRLRKRFTYSWCLTKPIVIESRSHPWTGDVKHRIVDNPRSRL